MTALLVWTIFVIWNVCDNFFPVCSTISYCHQFILLFASHQLHDVIITLQFDLTLLLCSYSLDFSEYSSAFAVSINRWVFLLYHSNNLRILIILAF